MLPLQFENPAFDVLERAFGYADADALFERPVDQAALFQRQIQHPAEIVHRLVGDDHQFARGAVEQIVDRQAALVLQCPGVGLRQCCDLAVAWQALASSIKPKVMQEIFRLTRTLRWNRLLFSFLAEYLGLPETLFTDDRVSSEPLRRIILEGGNFGHFAEARTSALLADERKRKRNTFSRFLHRLPFSLRYAPRETVATIWGLIRGNLH